MQMQSMWPVSYTHLDVYKRQREQTTAKSENEVIVRCTKDTNITPGKGKGIMRRSRNLR